MSDDGAAPAQDASPNAAPPRGAAIAEARGKRAYWFAAAAFTALILLVGALFLGIASAQRSADQARALATENGEITRQAELVQRLTVSTEASLRGYLLTDTPFYLESARRSLPNADAAMARLQTLAAAVPVLEAQVDAIAQRRAEALTAIRSSIGRLDAPARRRVVSLLREDDGRRMMRLGAAVADLRAMTATRQLAAAARIERASQRVNALLISLSAVFVAMIAVSIAFFVRETGVLLRVVRHLNRANAALLQARAAAEEADAAKTRFLAMASHDMRQPLHALTLYLAALRRRVDGAQALDILTRMEQAAGALTQMFTGLLDLARIESGVLKPAPTEFRLNDVFNALRAELHDDAERARVVLKILPTSAVLHSDRDMTASILRNLLTNALKYAPGGRVLMGCRRQGDRLRIEVHDEGEGIPEEKIAMLFDEFVRLDQVGPREAPCSPSSPRRWRAAPIRPRQSHPRAPWRACAGSPSPSPTTIPFRAPPWRARWKTPAPVRTCSKMSKRWIRRCAAARASNWPSQVRKSSPRPKGEATNFPPRSCSPARRTPPR
ncbi:MAG: ATP-binding protein [Hyphomonadaceae bacterium]